MEIAQLLIQEDLIQSLIRDMKTVSFEVGDDQYIY